MSPEDERKRWLTQRREAVQKIFQEPVALEFTDTVEKIRLNLMRVSGLTLVVLFLGVQISSPLTVMGVSLANLTVEKLKLVLLVINAYMLAHFCWLMLDAFQGWRLRLTGSGVAYANPGEFGNDDFDLSPDPRQSTLHNWWRVMASRLPELAEGAPTFDEVMEALRAYSPRLRSTEPLLGAPIDQVLGEIHHDVHQSLQELTYIKVALENPTPALALARFDRAYKLFLKSQSLRWLLLEAGAPVLLGVLSIASLIYSMSKAPIGQYLASSAWRSLAISL